MLRKYIMATCKERMKFKNWFVLSVCILSYGCTWEVWRAQEKRKS